MISILLTVLINIAPAYDFLNVEPYFTVPVATDTGVAAVNRNPAGLTRQRMFLFAQKEWISDATISTLQFNWNNYGFAINYYRFGKFEYHGNTPDDLTRTYFNPYAYEIKVGRSFQVDPEVKFGLMLQYFQETILYNSVHGFYMTVGLLYHPHRLKGLKAGVSFENVGFKTGFSEFVYRAPILGNFGVSYNFRKFDLSWNFSKVVTYEGALSSFSAGDVRNFFQVRYNLFDFLKIGGGYETGSGISPLILTLELRKSFISVLAGVRPIDTGLGSVNTLNLKLSI